MERMGVKDTLFVIVRHDDHDHPNCHIVYCRVDNNDKTISDHNDRFRSQEICKDITNRYGLHWGESRKKVNRERLRPHDAAKYHISDTLEVVVPQCRNWNQLQWTLIANSISVKFKCNPNTGNREGVSFGYNDGKENHVFPGSKLESIFPLFHDFLMRHGKMHGFVYIVFDDTMLDTAINMRGDTIKKFLAPLGYRLTRFNYAIKAID